MPTCVIDGKSIDFKPGENLVDIAKRGGVEIPVFCYHPGLSVVAQCRICVVEIEKAPKLMTACSTPATDGMVVHTKSAKVKEQQAAVMEFLLVNHPLDCPICDKSGECDLQDNSYKYGNAYMRSTEERRTYLDLDMGPVIKKNMNRCIHCTRCIRFGDEVAKVREMVAIQRGNSTEITTIDGRPLETEYAANYADICPTGSLTLKDFRFNKRVWFLKKTATVCEGCSRGCNMEIHQDAEVVHRCLPRTNMAINRHWLCDEGRFNFHYVNDKHRITAPHIGTGGRLVMTNWEDAIHKTKEFLKGKKVTVLVGSDLTQEEGKALLEFLPKYVAGAQTYHFGTKGIATSKADDELDFFLKRKSKTANLHGLEKLGFQAFEKLPQNTQAVLIFRGGRAQLPAIGTMPTVGVGVFNETEAKNFEIVLPGTSFAEKDGTIVNFQGVEQKLARAIQPPGQSKPVTEILMMWQSAHYRPEEPKWDPLKRPKRLTMRSVG